MDPDEALRQIRLLVKQMAEEDGTPVFPTFVQHARDLAEQVEALDEWLAKGGFPPAAWIPGARAYRPEQEVRG